MRVRPDLADCRHGGGLVRGIGVGVGEHHGDRSAALIQKRLRRCKYRVQIDGRADRAIGQRAFRHLKAQVARHDRREIPAQAPCARPVAAAHFQHVAQPFGGDDTDPCPLALQQRIGAGSCAMHDHRDRGQVRYLTADAIQKPARLVRPRRGHLRDSGRACGFVQHEDIRECAAHVDADHAACDCCLAHACTPFHPDPYALSASSAVISPSATSCATALGSRSAAWP